MANTNSSKSDSSSSFFFSKNKRLSFFWFLAAADDELLRKCSITEQYKQAGIGAAILLTTLAAGLSGYFAFVLLLKNWIAAPVAIFWSLIIFNLDRFMVGSIRKDENNNKWSEILIASPRILLATFIALLISRPIEVKIFANQIEDGRVSYTEKHLDTIAKNREIAIRTTQSIADKKAGNISELEKTKDCNKYSNDYINAYKSYEICKEEVKNLTERLEKKRKRLQYINYQ